MIYDSRCTSAGNPGFLSLEKNFVVRPKEQVTFRRVGQYLSICVRQNQRI
jgi:hypothetical protein